MATTNTDQAIREAARTLLSHLQTRPDLAVTRATIRDLRGLAELDNQPDMHVMPSSEQPTEQAETVSTVVDDKDAEAWAEDERDMAQIAREWAAYDRDADGS